MRKFAFVVFDYDNSIIERFAVDYVTDLSGLGWKLKISTLEGDIVDTITKVVQQKQDIKVTVNLTGNGYERFNVLSQWLQKFATAEHRIALEYDDGTSVRYAEGKATELSKTEKDVYGNLPCTLKFTPTTPFFRNIEQRIKIQRSGIGKKYPFKYPYSYGQDSIESAEINNPYLAAIPITVRITGSIFQPTIRLIDDNGDVYSTVKFSDITLRSGQSIVINSASKKIFLYNGSGVEDYTEKTDPSFDTFLMAQSGRSRISVNFSASDTGGLTGTWRQYEL